MYNAIVFENAGIPAVSLVNKNFVNDARSAASSRGMPAIRVVSEEIDCETTVDENIEAGIDSSIDDIIKALTRPLTSEEENPQPVSESPSRISFKGSLDEVNRFFYRRGWTDGLPIIPPTEAAVAEMMKGTDLPADHIVAKLIPRLGKATIEKIAINAVMAGALPTYMPILIAAIEALVDPVSRFDIYEVSTGSWSPFWVINGPIRHDINVNCSYGALSPGDIANATIGRAIGLIVKNIGGARKAVEDMGVLGNPGKYTLTLGENEEESPWEPLHVEKGCSKDDSAVTVFFPHSYCQMLTYGTNAEGILKTLAYNVNPSQGRGIACYIIIPLHAKTLAREGWTKQGIKEYVSKNAVLPLSHTTEYWRHLSGQDTIPQSEDPDTPRHLLSDPEYINIVVAGGTGAFIGLLTGAGGAIMHSNLVTKKINLPKSWDNLVNQYKNVVPVYARY